MSAGLPEVPTSRWRLRSLSMLVLLVVCVLAAGTYVFTRHVVADQEHRLLAQRTDEAGLYVSNLITSAVQSEFASLAGTVLASGGDATAFARATRLLTSVPGGFRVLALVKLDAADPQIVASSGPALEGGLSGDRLKAITTAVSAPSLTGALASTLVFTAPDGTRRLGFAYASPTLRGYAVYGESAIQSRGSSNATSGQPFAELYAAVYAGTSVHDNQLIGIAGGAKVKLPLTGDVAKATSPIGAGPPWLIVAKARHPLVGSVATQTPWFMFGAVLLTGLLGAYVIEVLARRREYALAVADERTEELKQSMTDLAVAQEQLVRQERLAAIGQLASTIGHELRNPLGVISNAVYLLRGDLGPTPTDAASRHISTAEREVSAATVIVADLLEFARQRDPVHTEVDAVALVEEALAVLPPPTGITVRREMPSPPVLLTADRDMLRQVLLNLVGNGYQAMPEGGTLTVALRTDGTLLHVSVRDDGVGMTPDVAKRVFEPFYTTKARGVGLGLAVSKRIVDAHGGDVAVVSAPGEGTTFTLTLPRVPAPRQGGEPTIDSSPLPAPSPSPSPEPTEVPT